METKFTNYSAPPIRFFRFQEIAPEKLVQTESNPLLTGASMHEQLSHAVNNVMQELINVIIKQSYNRAA